MSDSPHMVGVSIFERETGLKRRTFYNLLKKMKEVGVATEKQTKIDLNCRWMKNYLASNGVGQRKHAVVESSRQAVTHTHIPIIAPTDDDSAGDKPSLEELTFFEQLEKVNKLRIDNAIKSKSVVSKKIVQGLLNIIDGALNRIIIDGESSFVPRLCKKIRGGATDEDAKKFWRVEISKIIKPIKPQMQRSIKKFEDEK